MLLLLETASWVSNQIRNGMSEARRLSDDRNVERTQAGAGVAISEEDAEGSKVASRQKNLSRNSCNRHGKVTMRAGFRLHPTRSR